MPVPFFKCRKPILYTLFGHSILEAERLMSYFLASNIFKCFTYLIEVFYSNLIFWRKKTWLKPKNWSLHINCVCTLLETYLTTHSTLHFLWYRIVFHLSFEGKCNCKMQMSQLSLMGIICERLRLKRQPRLMFPRWMVGSQPWFGT